MSYFNVLVGNKKTVAHPTKTNDGFLSLYGERTNENAAKQLRDALEGLNASLGAKVGALSTDMTPVVGAVKSFIQVFTGYDIVSGERVHRGAESIGVGLGCLPGGKTVTKGKKAKEVGEEIIEQVSKNGDNKVYRGLAEGENIAQGLSARTPGG